jgi:hypothetical protein
MNIINSACSVLNKSNSVGGKEFDAFNILLQNNQIELMKGYWLYKFKLEEECFYLSFNIKNEQTETIKKEEKIQLGSSDDPYFIDIGCVANAFGF